MYRCESQLIKKAESEELMLLKKTLESSLDSKEIKLVNPKGNELWIFIRWTDADAPILWPLGEKSQLRKDPDARKYGWQEEKWATEDKMVGWHHPLNGHECEQAPGDCERQGSLACCSPWGCKESNIIEQLNSRLIHVVVWQKQQNIVKQLSSN